ncbi:MAG TPA: penicillin-binding protein 2 [Caulobacteraceae bacterium]|jgi:cell division protein FtsI (penicillin-binding protein 3)|nr:penicillin-binding protein 2 [Caulobacteraceae bacterium]
MSVAQPPFDGSGAPRSGPIAWLAPSWWWRSAIGLLEGSVAAGEQEELSENTRKRMLLVVALFAFGFLYVAIFATKAALFPNLPVRVATQGLPSARADIVDRNGQVLAMDLVRFGLYLRPQEIGDRAATKQGLMAALPGVSGDRLDQVLAHDAGEFYLTGGLTPEMKDRLHDLALPGIYFQEEAARTYPLGVTGAHVIGLASKDGTGMSGAEKALDAEARQGSGPVQVSLDLRVQGALQDELTTAAEHFGVKDAVGMVVNVRTGEILGMASWPNFDLNAPTRTPPENMVNHAAATVYEPGSVFKVFTLAMGLDTGKVKPGTVFNVCSPLILPGQIIHDYDKGDCTLPLWEVFTHSSNIGAAKMALQVGGDNEERYFHSFGLFQKAPSELIESARPLTPQRVTMNAVATMAFGQSISVSPLALATGMTSILNGGMYRPLTLRKLDPGEAPAPGRRVIQESTSRTMLKLMRLNATNGTGRGADVIAPGYMVGGKTGTATKLVNGHYDKGKRNLASFAAILPTTGSFDEDRYFVLIMMDEPKALPETGGFTTGGAVSAPIAGRIIARIAPFLNVPRIAIPPDQPAKGAGKDDVDPAILGDLDR